MTKSLLSPAAGTKSALALAIRQPWAELIMRGRKRIEYRSQQSHVRGRVFIYACLGRYARHVETEWAVEFKLDIDALPRGVIMGSVELFDCRPAPDGDGFQWWMRRPIRATELRRPDNQPQPVWFHPF
jgi:hypothetical protein